MPPAAPDFFPAIVRVCVSVGRNEEPNCKQRGAEGLLQSLARLAVDHRNKVFIQPSICLGDCESGPNVYICGGEVFSEVRESDLADILNLALNPAT